MKVEWGSLVRLHSNIFILVVSTDLTHHTCTYIQSLVVNYKCKLALKITVEALCSSQPWDVTSSGHRGVLISDVELYYKAYIGTF